MSDVGHQGFGREGGGVSARGHASLCPPYATTLRRRG